MQEEYLSTISNCFLSEEKMLFYLVCYIIENKNLDIFMQKI